MTMKPNLNNSDALFAGARRLRRFELKKPTCETSWGTGRRRRLLGRRKHRALERILAICACLSTVWVCSNISAQSADVPAPPQPPEDYARIKAEAQRMEKDAHEAEKTAAQQQEEYARAKEDVERAQKEHVTAFAPSASVASFGSSYSMEPALGDLPLMRILPRQPGRALVIRSSDVDAKAQGQLEEDLSVMSHILDTTVGKKFGAEKGHGTPMGINVLFPPGSSSIPSFNDVYIEGYGAVFMLNVSFPLLAPPARPTPEKEKPAADSTWKEAWQELYGTRPAESTATEPAVEYSEEKVTRLKESLLEALKNATNLRDVKSDEWITVCVFGNGGGGHSSKKATVFKFDSAGTGEKPQPQRPVRAWAYAGDKSGVPRATSTMTIRVRKSDADAFAKGKLSPEEFQKKAKIAIY
ncbi:MAG: hypothetical protein C5B50_19385 [Verrucomicrobia bacterium]|nr:MAG: hypothetical protein C5B50_19385 [Verrucomicrobiota bacterium]